jgi:hypothetical protein
MSGKLTSFFPRGAVPDQDDSHRLMCKGEISRCAGTERRDYGMAERLDISSRIDNKLSRNSTCTIVVMVLRNLCLSEQSCAETRREFGSFR